MSNDAACESAKIVQVGDYWSFNGQTNAPLTWHGAGEQFGVHSGMFRNKWWRLEGYLDTHDNPRSHTIILKNISDNGPEFTRTVNTGFLFGADAQNWLSGFTHWIHMYRDDRAAAGSCTNRYMHLVVAKNLGPNERIPPASEVEGGGGGGPTADRGAPNTPTGLTVR
jgi:hypothetical protein